MFGCDISCIASLIGYGVVGYILYRSVELIGQLTRPAKDLSLFGDYSVVTGPTSGIGHAIALELAKRGQNLILIGRNETKLSNVKKEIVEKYNKCNVITLQIDLSKMNQENEKLYIDTIKKYNVGILINNAGLACMSQLKSVTFVHLGRDSQKRDNRFLKGECK